MASSNSNRKLILVIGATGAQGMAVIKGLLAPSPDGLSSPYAVRALTRDADSRRAKELAFLGVNIFQGTYHVNLFKNPRDADVMDAYIKGSFDNLAHVSAALEGVYGAWVNTDSFTVGEQKETYLGMRIFELAKQNGAVRHYVWSSLDYAFKASAPRADYGKREL